MKMIWKCIACGAVLLLIAGLTGCESETPIVRPGQPSGGAMTSSSGIKETHLGPGAPAQGDIQTLRENTVRDRQTLNEANRAVGVLGR